MTSINQIFNFNQKYDKIQTNTLGIKKEEKSVLETGGGMDTVSFGQNKSENFETVFAQMRQNVPDSTSTIPEKELAISYINRMLACEDISDDLKIYWQNKKSVIQQEIQNIKNKEKTGSGEKVDDVWSEFEKFVAIYQGKFNKNLSVEDRSEYLITYNKTCQSFIKRLMACSDITDELIVEYTQMYQNHENDLNNAKRDLLNAKKR